MQKSHSTLAEILIKYEYQSIYFVFAYEAAHLYMYHATKTPFF